MEIKEDRCSSCYKYGKISQSGGQWLCRLCIHFQNKGVGELDVIPVDFEERIAEGVWEDGESIAYRHLGTGKYD